MTKYHAVMRDECGGEFGADRFKAHYIFQFDAGLFWWVMS